MKSLLNKLIITPNFSYFADCRKFIFSQLSFIVIVVYHNSEMGLAHDKFATISKGTEKNLPNEELV